jgi:hypothetical protein
VAAGAGALEPGTATGSAEHGGDVPRRGVCESFGGRMGGGCGLVHSMIPSGYLLHSHGYVK